MISEAVDVYRAWLNEHPLVTEQAVQEWNDARRHLEGLWRALEPMIRPSLPS